MRHLNRRSLRFATLFLLLAALPVQAQDSATSTGTTGPAYTSPDNASVVKGAAQIRYATYMGTSMSYTTSLYLLLKDGSYCRNLNNEPSNAALAASKKSNPKDWGRWQINGKKLVLTKPTGKTSKYSDWNMLKPKPKDYRLDGYFKSEVGDTGTGGDIAATALVAARGYRFYPDGSFQSSSSASAIAHAPAGVGTRSARAQSGGKYFIDGYTIVLTFDSGEQVTRTFASFASKRKGYKDSTIFIGERDYIQP
ncbi:MAG: hypothetical protein AAFM91_13415 [Pseudomonadota bacterium]